MNVLKNAASFLGLMVIVAIFVLLSNFAFAPDDPEGMRPTAESVTDLGRTARAERPTRDPLFGQPFKELCRDVGNNKEICR